MVSGHLEPLGAAAREIAGADHKAEEQVFVSDFYVVQVEGNDWKRATRFLLQESLWTKLGKPFWVEREQLARTIADGFVVEVMPEEPECSFGRRVLLVGLDCEDARFTVEGART